MALPSCSTIWRWHFHAGLLVLPVLLILALTGSIYLFKPQIEHIEERHFRNLPVAGAVAPGEQVGAALKAFPQAKFGSYRLPERPGDAAMLTLELPAGTRQVFVSPQGKVLGSLAPEKRVAEVVKKIHSQLFLGKRGSWLVELAASWAFVLLASGLYLWWPRRAGLAGVLWPRLKSPARWRDLHAVGAFWLYGLVAVLLLSSLPWTSVWGSAFQKLRTELGLVEGLPEWTLGGEPPAAALPLGGEPPADPHAGHHGRMAAMPEMPEMSMPATTGGVTLDTMVEKARAARLPFPVYVAPPGGMGRFGAPSGNLWTIYSDTQNRPQQRTLTFAPESGKLLATRTYDNGNPIDRVIGYGIAWHEGQLFGRVNQLVGLLTAFGIIGIALSGLVLWLKREPLPLQQGRRQGPAGTGGALVILLLLAAFLPLLALSLGVLFPGYLLWRAVGRPASAPLLAESVKAEGPGAGKDEVEKDETEKNG